MTTTDYLINGVFVLVVLRQARERQLDLRSLLAPLALVLFVAHNYIHTIPTAGNDLVLIALLASVGLALGAAAWPVALVSMALCEVTARLVIVHLRGWRLVSNGLSSAVPFAPVLDS